MTDDAIQRASDLLSRKLGVESGRAHELVAQQVQLMQPVLAYMEKLLPPKDLRDKLEQLAEAAAKFAALALETEFMVQKFLREPGELSSLARQMKGIASSLETLAAMIVVPPGSMHAPLAKGFAVQAAANIAQQTLGPAGGNRGAKLVEAFGRSPFQELAEALYEAIEGKSNPDVAGSLDHQIRAYRRGTLDFNQGRGLMISGHKAPERRRRK